MVRNSVSARRANRRASCRQKGVSDGQHAQGQMKPQVAQRWRRGFKAGAETSTDSRGTGRGEVHRQSRYGVRRECDQCFRNVIRGKAAFGTGTLARMVMVARAGNGRLVSRADTRTGQLRVPGVGGQRSHAVTGYRTAVVAARIVSELNQVRWRRRACVVAGNFMFVMATATDYGVPPDGGHRNHCCQGPRHACHPDLLGQ